MQSGTALGLLVGGAVLLLAVSPPRASTTNASGAAVPSPAPGGMLNPFNWFGAGGQPTLGQQVFGGAQQPAAPGGYMPVGQSPAFRDASYTPAPTTGGYDPNNAGIGTPANFQYPVLTPGGGFQSLAYMSPASPAQTGGGGFQNAGYTSPASPAQTGIWA